jgi:hypothetical protein
MIYNITLKERETVEKFADARSKDSCEFYKFKRGAFKREDIVCGAMGELAAYAFCMEQGIEVSEPDFTIHTNKSFGADLIDEDNGIHFHVKAQSKQSVAAYGNSYLFQKTDKLVRNVLPEGEQHWIICCIVDLDNDVVEIVGELSPATITWGKPRIAWLEKTKVALYVKNQSMEPATF